MKTIVILLFLPGIVLAQEEKPRLVVPIGHTEAVTSVAFSPDGQYVLTGSADYTAKLWDLSGRQIRSFKADAYGVQSVAFSPDGKYLLTCGGNGTARLWDLEGRPIQSFDGHASVVNSAIFSPDGKYILTGSGDNTAKLWDLDGHLLQTFSGHDDQVSDVAFSPDGKHILTGSLDKTAVLWDLSGRQTRSFEALLGIRSVAFSPDGKYILAGSAYKTAILWDLSGREIRTFHAASVYAVAFSPDGRFILTGNGDNEARLWDLSGRQIRSLQGHTDLVSSVAFSPDGRYILTGGGDHTARLWDLTGRQIQSCSGHANQIFSAAFSPDGQYVLTAGDWQPAKLWNFAERRTISFPDHNSRLWSAVFSSDGQHVMTGSQDTAQLWDLSGRLIRSFTGDDFCNLVALSPDSQYVLTGGREATLWRWSGEQVRRFSGHDSNLSFASFSSDGKYFLTGSYDKTAKLWDLSGRLIQSFAAHPVLSATFSPDGRYVLTGGEDYTARLWDMTGQAIRFFTGHKDPILSVAFSPDGQYVLTGSSDETAKLWDLSGREIRSFTGHNSYVVATAFSPDGRYVLTGSGDNTIKLWDAQTGRELVSLISIDSADWVITTPSGLFDASPGAMKLMHYIQGLEVIALDQLKERYYEPGLLAKVLGFDKGELRNVVNFEQVALYPEIKASIEKDRLNITLTERNGGLGKLSLFINDKEVQEDLNPSRQKAFSLDLKAFAKYYRTDTANTLTLRAYNAEGWLKSEAYQLTYQPALPAKASRTPGPGMKAPPSLYALVIGTSDYSGEKLDLRFADLDAEAIAKAFQSAGAALFTAERTTVALLSTAGTTSTRVSSKTNIRQAFADLAAKATPADVLVVYFSGHGLAYGPAEKEQFYYLTKDIGSEDLSDPEVRNNYTISSNEFTQWLTAIPAQKQVMILDACNAGKVVESLATIAQKALDPSQIRALDRMKDRTGMFILTGSAADKVSYEASQYGQGLLTYSLLQGMSGMALTEDKRVDVMTLFQYSRDKVPELAKGIGGLQTPVLAFPAGGASFDIGIVNAGVKIPVAQVKPVFIRNNFQEEASFDDVLGLTSALAAYFRQITARGAQAEMLYVDVSEYENAYSMKGRYTIKGDDVEVRGRLFKGKESKGEFQVAGKKSDVPGLVTAIVGKVAGMVK